MSKVALYVGQKWCYLTLLQGFPLAVGMLTGKKKHFIVYNSLVGSSTWGILRTVWSKNFFWSLLRNGGQKFGNDNQQCACYNLTHKNQTMKVHCLTKGLFDMWKGGDGDQRDDLVTGLELNSSTSWTTTATQEVERVVGWSPPPRCIDECFQRNALCIPYPSS